MPLLVMIVLSSCRKYGQEITGDKVRVIELEKAISAKMNEPKAFEAHIVASKSEIRFGGNKKDYFWDLYYYGDKKDSISISAALEIESSGEKEKYNYKLYVVDDPTYDKVYYIEVSGSNYSAKNIEVYAIRSDSDEYSTGTYLPGNLAFPIKKFKEICDPYYLDQTLTEYTTAFPRRYFSEGDDSLTIEMSDVTIGNTTNSTSTRATYKNYLLKDATFESKDANNMYQISQKLELSYRTLYTYSITLPSGWENRIIGTRGSSY